MSFLNERHIQVVLDGKTSSRHTLNSGVPQGSVLSPTLFLIFIDDPLRLTNNPIHSFADDSTLHSSFSSPSNISPAILHNYRKQSYDSMNADLSLILDWGKTNLVSFNASKTQSCLFSHKKSSLDDRLQFGVGNFIDNTNTLSMLGVNLSSNMCWQDHLRNVSLNAARRLGFLRRCKKFISVNNLYTIYKAFIRPLLEFNSHLWAGAPSSTLNMVDRIQNRAVRILGENQSEPLHSLEHRRTVSCLSLFYRYINGHCSNEICNIMPSFSTPDPRLRSSSTANRFSVVVDRARTQRFYESFIPRTSRLWNLLPDTIFPESYNLPKFKRNLNYYLLQNPL